MHAVCACHPRHAGRRSTKHSDKPAPLRPWLTRPCCHWRWRPSAPRTHSGDSAATAPGTCTRSSSPHRWDCRSPGGGCPGAHSPGAHLPSWSTTALSDHWARSAHHHRHPALLYPSASWRILSMRNERNAPIGSVAWASRGAAGAVDLDGSCDMHGKAGAALPPSHGWHHTGPFPLPPLLLQESGAGACRRGGACWSDWTLEPAPLDPGRYNVSYVHRHTPRVASSRFSRFYSNDRVRCSAADAADQPHRLIWPSIALSGKASSMSSPRSERDILAEVLSFGDERDGDRGSPRRPLHDEASISFDACEGGPAALLLAPCAVGSPPCVLADRPPLACCTMCIACGCSAPLATQPPRARARLPAGISRPRPQHCCPRPPPSRSSIPSPNGSAHT
jgi:hypothetical protein